VYYITEIHYSKYTDGIGYEDKIDSFKTKTNCEFNYGMVSVRYERFLDTTVVKTIETMRKMVLIALDNALCENRNIHSLIMSSHESTAKTTPIKSFVGVITF